jgi:hypothetical protein
MVAGICVTFLLSVTQVAFADQPEVTAVPGDANNPTVRHPVIIGRPITLKGAVDEASIGADWSWDPGDGSAAITGTVAAPHWAVWIEHTYAGNAGDFFTATLTVDNGVDIVGTATFEMVARADTVPNRANTAIAESLWYMHRTQTRFDGDEIAATGLPGSVIPMGSWSYPTNGGTLTVSVQGGTLNAFEANGHRETGDADNPYSETVSRGMNYLFARLRTEPMSIQTVGSLDANPRNDDPDSNGNGLGIRTDSRVLGGINGSSDGPYQLGMVMDAIVASGTLNAVTTTGPADVIGRRYADIVQDMVDWYAWAQTDSVSHGSWVYSPYDNSAGAVDNSAAGWAATGVVAAEDIFGSIVPAWLKVRNEIALETTDNESDVADNDGVHGYRSSNPLWGAYGTSGAAMVQMSMDGIVATSSAAPDERWVRSENMFRRHFDDPAIGNNFKNYYYGMFNFTKAMRTAKPASVNIIGTQVGAAEGGIGCGPSAGCAPDGPQPLDWYNDPATGLAQTVTSHQETTGANIGRFISRTGNSHGNRQNKHTQPWATQILTRTLAQAGPIAVGSASPNPTGENFPVTLDHSRSFHQDPNRSLVLFEWDIDNNGTFDLSTTELQPDPPLGVPGGYNCDDAGSFPCSHTLNLRVTDNAVPPVTTTDVVILDLTVPPHAPTANAGGPYLVCVGDTLSLDGTASFDIDEGTREDGATEDDRITAYEWELDGVSPFDYGEATGDSAMWTFDTVGISPIGLRVTDNSALAFPSASAVNLTDTDNTFVTVADCITADLAVTATAAGSDFIIPTQFTTTVTVSNGGPDDVTQVIVVANLSDLVDLVSITPDQGSCAATGIANGTQVQYECAIGDIAAGATVNIVAVFDADTEGSADFDFAVDIDSGPLVDLDDPDPSNNFFAVTITLVDEVIVVIIGKGKGSGSMGALEVLLLLAAAGFVVMRRRRRLMGTTLTAVIAAGLLMIMTVNNTAQAQDVARKGFYLGFGMGKTDSSMSANEFGTDLVNLGYNVSNVTIDEDSFGWKIYAGYMFNQYIGAQLGWLDLGKLESQFTASVAPNQIDDLLRASTNLLPGRGKGVTADVVLQYPFSERFAIYGTLGMFFAAPETTQEVQGSGVGSASRSESDKDFAASIGVSMAFGSMAIVKLGYERYDIDGLETDFPMAAIQFGFGGN